MSTVTAFVGPAPTRSNQLFRSVAQKRKRHQETNVTQEEYHDPSDEDAPNNVASSAEYAAVLTPAERSQRRLAGLPVNQEMPSFPFPHASLGARDQVENTASRDSSGGERSSNRHTKLSLHAQHLATISAILHRSLMSHDWTRAHRAMGLILRNEVGGYAVDIRTDGMWGIGAEILLHSASTTTTQSSISGSMQALPISQDGFERAKAYYENLMVQYPLHKAWPGAVNSLDFCIAMFELWVYVIYRGSSRIEARITNDEAQDHPPQNATSLIECKTWEAEQVKRIVEALNVHMRDAVYKSHPDLIRLQNMVAMWYNDVLATCTQLANDHSFH